jgi:hypothetical protein
VALTPQANSSTKEVVLVSVAIQVPEEARLEEITLPNRQGQFATRIAMAWR